MITVLICPTMERLVARVRAFERAPDYALLEILPDGAIFEARGQVYRAVVRRGGFLGSLFGGTT